MSTTVNEFRSVIRRKAICMEIGGFRPPECPTASWFGRTSFALPGEPWPCTDGMPMHALCQINLTELPFRPPRLKTWNSSPSSLDLTNCQPTLVTERIGA